MNPTFLSRLHAAASLIFKSGAPFPFNKIMPYDATGGERMYRAYEQSTWVMRAIKKIAGPIAAVNLNLARDGQHFHRPDLDAFWEAPGAGLSRHDFIEATVGWLKLEGEAFWILDDSWLVPFPHQSAATAANRIIVARPDRLRHMITNGALVGWDYVDGAGAHSVLLPEQVIQTKMWNPYNDWRGLAELHPCRDAAEADFLAGKFNLNLMRNNGDQGVYVIAKDGTLTDVQRQQIVDQIREKRELAQRGVFKPVFLGADITIEDPKIRVPDAAFNATRLQNRHEIYIAMGVPASMADVKASYSIGSASDWFMLISETCIPTADKICQSINQVLRRQTGLNIKASLNWDEHPVIQAVRRERADTASKYFQMGVPLKILNDYLDLELPPCPDWEKGYLAFNLASIGQAPLPEKNSDLGEPMDDTVALMRQTPDALATLKKLLAQPRATNPKPERDEQELAQWRELMARRRETIKAWESRCNRELMNVRAAVLAKVEQGQSKIPDLDQRISEFSKTLHDALRPITETAWQTAGEHLFSEVGKQEAFAAPAERLGEFVKSREPKLARVAAKIYHAIARALENAAPAEGPAAVRACCNEISKQMVPAIATNEIGAAFSASRDTAMRQAGVTHKRWLASAHLTVRPSHLAANGQTVALDDAFSVGGENLRYPCDETASAATVTRCQCVALPCSPGKGVPPAIARKAPGLLTRTLHPEVRIIDERNGIVDYVASDESIDSYREIIRATGWRFTNFAKNAPFVDSHDYSTIEKCLGKVIDFRVEGPRLIERVQWAIDVPENKLAQIGWKMTQAGYLKAVSVGFHPVKYVTPHSGDAWTQQLRELGLPADAPVRTIYTEQEQVELSCCVVGANANALANAYQAGAITDADIETLSVEYSHREHARAAHSPALAAPAREQARQAFLEKLQQALKQQ